ncbi:MAG: hypothetical protein OQK04_11290 [Kangiellaceae bacterium]|nr:hypothetical protein [Kangiellaceae bacterium]MCW8999288.1 hypothetical protein [Kangiellaceae bacterium]
MGRNVIKNPLEHVKGMGRQGDAIVDGLVTEFKTASNGATHSTIKNIINKSKKGTGQARQIVIDARGTGLLEADALRGIGRGLGGANGKVDYVSVIGDGYFVGRGVN